MGCEIDRLDCLDESDERKFWVLVERELRCDDGEAGKSHLHAGRPIYYCVDEFTDEIVREWPDGRKELVHVSDTGEISSSRQLTGETVREAASSMQALPESTSASTQVERQ